jgi:hypothetical protein
MTKRLWDRGRGGGKAAEQPQQQGSPPAETASLPAKDIVAMAQFFPPQSSHQGNSMNAE